MQYKSLLRNGAIIITAAMLTLAACKRKDTTTTTAPALTTADDNGGYASDGAKLESTSNDVISIADAAASGSGSNLRTTGSTISSCASVLNDTVHHVLTINFGSVDCTCLDGKTRRGEIIVNYNTIHYKDSGSKHTITYSNYFVNDFQVTGSKTVTNEGTNMSGQVWYTVAVNDSIILGTDSVISWTANRTRTWIDGYSTPGRGDDVYSIADVSGMVTTLTRANGHVFNIAISPTDPLKVALACPWIEAGTVTITGTSLAQPRILDYGAVGASCNPSATLTIGSHTYTIILK